MLKAAFSFHLNRQKNHFCVQVYCCSETPEPVQCGISRVWVLADYRRARYCTVLYCTILYFPYAALLGLTGPYWELYCIC